MADERPTTLDELLAEHDTLARGRARASRRTRSPPTAATSAATPTYLRRARRSPTPARVDEATVAAYVEELAAGRATTTASRGYAPSSIARALVAVRSFHRFCVEEGLVDVDPSEEVGAPRVPQGIPKALTEAEVEALLGAVAGDDPRALRDRAILETLYATGVRISELVGLDRARPRPRRRRWSACSARATRSGSCRSAAPRAAALDDYLAPRPARSSSAAARAPGATATRCS